MKPIITLCSFVFFMVSISSAQLPFGKSIALAGKLANKPMQLASSKLQLGNNDILSVGLNHQRIEETFQLETILNEHQSNALLHSDFYQQKDNLNTGQFIGLALTIGGAVPTIYGLMLLASGDFFGIIFGGGLLIGGLPCLTLGIITLSASSARKGKRKRNNYGKVLQLESKSNSLALVYHF